MISKARLVRTSHLLLAGMIVSQFGAPVAAQIAVSGDLIEVQDGVRPGEAYAGALTLRNTGSDAAVASIYVNDVLFEGQEQSYLEPGQAPRSNADWLELEMNSAHLAAGESLTLGYSVTVPEEVDLSDSYWSMIMVENAPVGGESGTSGVSIRSVTRYGIYVVTNMAESGKVQLDFVDPRLDDDDQEGAIFVVSIRNSGWRLVRPQGYLDLYDANGGLVTRIEDNPALIFPEAEVGRSYRLGHLPPGNYTAVVVVDAGAEDVFGARYTLKLEE